MFVFDFRRAQPAIINRQAMNIMKRSIEYLMLSRLQSLWGNSHDVVLGMLLWLHDLPAIPLHSVMHYCPINQGLLASGALQMDPVCGHVLIYHKVSRSLVHSFIHVSLIYCIIPLCCYRKYYLIFTLFGVRSCCGL